MRFTNGFWLLREGVRAYYGKTAHRIDRTDSGLTIFSPSKVIADRGDTLNIPLITTRLHSPMKNIIGMKVTHHEGGIDRASGGEADEAVDVGGGASEGGEGAAHVEIAGGVESEGVDIAAEAGAVGDVGDGCAVGDGIEGVGDDAGAADFEDADARGGAGDIEGVGWGDGVVGADGDGGAFGAAGPSSGVMNPMGRLLAGSGGDDELIY